MSTLLAFFVAAMLAWGAPEQQPAAASSRLASSHSSSLPGAIFTRAHRPVSTTSASAQAEFDDGLTLLYAFNPTQARLAFEAARAADPKLGMAWWGIAMSYGININTSFDAAQAKLGHAAIGRARTLEDGASAANRALIDAAAQRFAYDAPNDARRSADAYRDAMDAAADAFPQDDDIQTLAAEAAMDAEFGNDYSANGTPLPQTTRIVARLQRVLARDPAHIGANHLLIHALEQSHDLAAALPSADRLAADNFEPAAEHLAHVPAHIYMQVGRYHDAGVVNARALSLYRRYLAADPDGDASYMQHDCTFGVDAFMMSGEYERARNMAASCADDGPGLVPVVDVRFRRWTALASDGTSTDLGSGLFDAHFGRLRAAREHLANLQKLTGAVAKIQADLVGAAIARTSGDRTAELARLQHAVALEDGLGYSEPPPFFYPVRETLGAAYVLAKRYSDAETVFRADLAAYPNDPRALLGLAETLSLEGRVVAAQRTHAQFSAAWKGSAPPSLAEM